MGVSYTLLDKNEKIIAVKEDQACFSDLAYYGDVAEFNRIAYINYHVKVTQTTKIDAKSYLQCLKDIGFNINQIPSDILTNGYMMNLVNFRREGRVYASEIGAHLTVVRYVDEFGKIIMALLNLLDINPGLNKWLAFQIAHLFVVQGKHSHAKASYYGEGHCLLTPSIWSKGAPYKTWPEVEKAIVSSPSWRCGFSRWNINTTYGQPYSLSAEQRRTCAEITIIDTKSLQRAITCIKSLYVPKAII